MTLHQQRTHPTYVEGCFACKCGSISISADALPTRGKAVSSMSAQERRMDRNLDAFKRLCDDGLNPATCANAAKLERTAETREHIEFGKSLRMTDPKTGKKRWVKSSAIEAFGERFGHLPQEPAKDVA